MNNLEKIQALQAGEYRRLTPLFTCEHCPHRENQANAAKVEVTKGVLERAIHDMNNLIEHLRMNFRDTESCWVLDAKEALNLLKTLQEALRK